MRLTFGISSASRPHLLEQTLLSIDQMVNFSGEIAWVFHEDYIFPDRSDCCLELVNNDGRFSEILVTKEPPHANAYGIARILEVTETEFLARWEDDWILEREIEMDLVVGLMENNEDINQIVFYKRGIDKKHISGKYYQEPCLRDNCWITTTAVGWHVIPSVWRVSYARPKWKPIGARTRVTSGRLNGPDWPAGLGNPEYIKKHVGTYFWGNVGDKRFLHHIGAGDLSMRFLQDKGSEEDRRRFFGDA